MKVPTWSSSCAVARCDGILTRHLLIKSLNSGEYSEGFCSFGISFCKQGWWASQKGNLSLTVPDVESSSLPVTDACPKTAEFRRQSQWQLFRWPKYRLESRTVVDRGLPKKENSMRNCLYPRFFILRGPSKTVSQRVLVLHLPFGSKYCAMCPY